jgi:hypothetical protein
MDALIFFGTGFIAGDANPLRKPDNDNWRLMPEWRTPAEFLQRVRREKERLRRELLADVRLLTCPTHRRTWSIRLAMEKCCLWHYYGLR